MTIYYNNIHHLAKKVYGFRISQQILFIFYIYLCSLHFFRLYVRLAHIHLRINLNQTLSFTMPQTLILRGFSVSIGHTTLSSLSLSCTLPFSLSIFRFLIPFTSSSVSLCVFILCCCLR